MQLIFEGTVRPLTVGGSALPQVSAMLLDLLPAWPCRRREHGIEESDVSVERDGAKLAIASRRGAEILTVDADVAAFDVSVLLIRAAREQSDRLMAMHAAAAVVGSGAALLVGPSMAGKSSLAAHLSASGRKLISDDTVLLRRSGSTGCEVVALGSGLKLRPLPGTCPAAFRQFVAERCVRQVAGSLICRPKDREAAAFGDAWPAGAIFLLDRRTGGRTSLQKVQDGEAVRLLMGQLGAGHVMGRDVLQALLALVRAAPVRRLVFSDSADAAATVAAAMARSPAAAA